MYQKIDTRMVYSFGIDTGLLKGMEMRTPIPQKSGWWFNDVKA
jgi:hypothetical protein